MKKMITVEQFAAELIERIEKAKDIDCCKEEIRNLADIAREHFGEKKIEVNWKD